MAVMMKITIKQLQGGECCLEVDPTTSILDIKKQVAEKLNVPVSTQRLLHLGRTLADEQELKSYPAIKDGTKLNLYVKKPEELYDVALKEFKKMGMTDMEAAKAANRLLIVIKKKVYQLSWDDMDRLCKDFLLIKAGKRKLHTESNNVFYPASEV